MAIQLRVACKINDIIDYDSHKMKNRLLSFLFVGFFLCAAARGDSHECVYTMYVKTGSIINGGTDSKISVTLGDSTGRTVWIPNIRRWGLMGSTHDYFERGNLDAFTGRGPCIGTPICTLNLISDGSGDHHGWYCDSVEVTSIGLHRRCSQSTFFVDQWLALDAPPYQLSAVLDHCNRTLPHHDGKLILRSRDPKISSSI
ncbi:hypothetical protein RIF29_32778 [Crotalaria pallida]|uniref:PLAT domain-containing protein n=1 Tax=Crotalaria pallida TaxID=3830 RepID=A0AAN9ENQ9_CROPI